MPPIARLPSAVAVRLVSTTAAEASFRVLPLHQRQAALALRVSPPDGCIRTGTVRAALAAGRFAEAQLRAGRNLAVHCAYGIGRTWMFLAALAGHVLGMQGPDALTWVRQWRPGAAETDEQEDMASDTLAVLASDCSPGPGAL